MAYIDRMTDRRDAYGAVLCDQGMAEPDFLRDALKVMGTLLPDMPAKHGMTDAVMFDSNQNEWTQYLERRYWSRIGISEIFLDHYYSFRHHYKMLGANFSAKPTFEKTSGEPGTLTNNGNVSKVLSNAIVRGEGPCVLMSKGDDFDKYQLNLYVDKDAQETINKFCPLRLKVKIADAGEFCGYTITQDGFLPNLVRRVYKILGCRWRDYKHFCCYQESLRDYVDVVKQVGLNKAISAAMSNFGCSQAEAEYCYYFIESMAHINETQWLQTVTRHTVTPSIPVVGDGLNAKNVVMHV